MDRPATSGMRSAGFEASLFFGRSLPGFLTAAEAHQVMPRAFIAAVIGSEKKTGSTRSTISLGKGSPLAGNC